MGGLYARDVCWSRELHSSIEQDWRRVLFRDELRFYTQSYFCKVSQLGETWEPSANDEILEIYGRHLEGDVGDQLIFMDSCPYRDRELVENLEEEGIPVWMT
ncbi:hypothetical protein TNIN_116221 [Trichonephila inaurata madagascariensis]|uniref:Uncharacterized protein n=1 Tax=Trichonephila inaurata madagascariensis TaxID=2747483 RepID=A0A8X7BQ45_9ARAC|nr:hypothetical protein TNIN_116221 [Trichonephila inaurata madagascariensis]